MQCWYGQLRTELYDIANLNSEFYYACFDYEVLMFIFSRNKVPQKMKLYYKLWYTN